MKELNELTAQKMTELCTNGTLESMIEDSLTKMLKDQVESSIRSYSDFGKAIGEKINASINASLSHVSLPEYNHFIKDLVLSTYNDSLKKQAQAQIIDVISDKLETVPAEINFETLSEKVKDYWANESEGKEYIDLEWHEHGDESIEVTFKHPQYDWYSFKVIFYRFTRDAEKGWFIGYIKSDKSHTGSAELATGSHDLLGYFYKLYAARTYIIDLHENQDEGIYIGHDY